MKNLKITLAALSLVFLADACRTEKRHVIISEGNNYGNLKIEYSGWAKFNNDSTAIASISPNGYVKYKKNNERLVAESDANGTITYQVNGSDKEKTLSAGEKIFLAQAVQDMIKHGHYNDEKK